MNFKRNKLAQGLKCKAFLIDRSSNKENLQVLQFKQENSLFGLNDFGVHFIIYRIKKKSFFFLRN